MFFDLQQAYAMAPPNGQQGGGGSLISTLVMFGAVILIMYFLMIRPQQKRQSEHKKMLESIKKGDRVITTSGMHGTVVELDDKTITLQIGENTKVKFERVAVSTKI